MKTKEEILKEATKKTLNINEGSPLHDAVMKAMEEYAQQQLLKFCDHLNTYKGFEDCRFDFMLIDFKHSNDKT